MMRRSTPSRQAKILCQDSPLLLFGCREVLKSKDLTSAWVNNALAYLILAILLEAAHQVDHSKQTWPPKSYLSNTRAKRRLWKLIILAWHRNLSVKSGIVRPLAPYSLTLPHRSWREGLFRIQRIVQWSLSLFLAQSRPSQIASGRNLWSSRTAVKAQRGYTSRRKLQARKLAGLQARRNI